MRAARRQLLGRDGELEAVAAFLAGPAPAVLLVEGEPGIGKSELWSAGVARTRADRHDVLVARPLGEERALGFSGLADLLGAVDPAVRAGLPPPQRHALAVALLEEEPRDPAQDARTTGTALLSVLRALAAGSEVLVAVDDLQWLDAPTQAALSFALRRLERERVRMLATLRTGAGRAARRAPAPALRPQPRGDPRAAARAPRPRARAAGAASACTRSRAATRSPRWSSRAGSTRPRRRRRRGAFRCPRASGASSGGASRRSRRRRGRRCSTSPQPVEPLPLSAALEPALAAGLVTDDGGRARFVHPLYGEAVYAEAPPHAGARPTRGWPPRAQIPRRARGTWPSRAAARTRRSPRRSRPRRVGRRAAARPPTPRSSSASRSPPPPTRRADPRA